MKRHVGALDGEGEADGAPETLPGARDDNHLVGQPEIHAAAIVSAAWV